MKTHSETTQPWNLDPSKKTIPHISNPHYSLVEFTIFDRTHNRIFRFHLDEFETENQFKRSNSVSFFYNNLQNGDYRTLIEPLHSVDSLSDQLENFPYFSIEKGSISFSKNIFKISFSQTKLDLDIHYEMQEKSHLERAPFFIHNTSPNKTYYSFPQASLQLTGKLTLEGEVFEFKNAHGLLTLSQGIYRETQASHAYANHFVSEGGEPLNLKFYGYSILSPTYFQSLQLPYHSYYIVFNEQVYRFNNLKNYFKIKQKFTDHSWEFQLQSGKFLFKGVIQTTIADMFLQRFENTDSSLIFKSFSMNAKCEFLIFEEGRLLLRGLSPQMNLLELTSTQQSPYIQKVLE